MASSLAIRSERRPASTSAAKPPRRRRDVLPRHPAPVDLPHRPVQAAQHALQPRLIRSREAPVHTVPGHPPEMRDEPRQKHLVRPRQSHGDGDESRTVQQTPEPAVLGRAPSASHRAASSSAWRARSSTPSASQDVAVPGPLGGGPFAPVRLGTRRASRRGGRGGGPAGGGGIPTRSLGREPPAAARAAGTVPPGPGPNGARGAAGADA
ncbi:hypothetical protein ACU686_01495 [Yinghuangia aomiensis]